VHGITVRPGATLDGCCHFSVPLYRVPEGFDAGAPFVTWPDDIRRYYEHSAVILLAGPIGAVMLSPPAAGRVPESVAEEAAGMVEKLAGQAEVPDEVTVLRQLVDEPLDTDATRVAKMCWAAHGDDLIAAGAWLGWVEAAARSVVSANEKSIRRTAAILAEQDTLSGGQLAAALGGPGLTVVRD
jgi:hypothetical protein